MALISCVECGQRVSDQAGKCPHCGVKIQKPAGKGWVILGGLVVAMFVIAGINSNRVERENAAAAVASAAIEAAKTPEQKEAEAKIKREAENRMNKVSVAVIAVHNVMRDPESLRWSLVLANADASVICLEYRARNGFGGMNVENLVFVKDMPYKSVTKWNKHCTSDSLFDMKSVTLSIAKS